MTTSSSTTLASSSLIPAGTRTRTTSSINSRNHHHQFLFLQNGYSNKNKRFSFTVQAAKPPAGVEFPKVQPQFKAPFLGFTKTAEVWNSRACMIGLIGTFIVELIINKGILEVIGVEIGKGLDIPL